MPVTLTEKEKRQVLERFACFDTLQEVQKFVEETFGKKIDRKVLWRYNAGSPAARKDLSAEHVEWFDECRQRFRKETEGIPIANKAYQLRLLQKSADQALGAGAFGMLPDIVETAAKLTGGAFTNRRELTGADGGPIKTKSEDAPLDLSKLSKDQLAELDQLLSVAEPD